MGDIEVEIKSFITKEQYEGLLARLREQCDIENEDHQETHYFDAPVDVRIQRNDTCSKIVFKAGKVHDEMRKELEVECHRDDFGKLEAIFHSLGHKTKIQWFRTRHTFLWEEITVTVDYTRGYGYIVELERMSTPEEQEQTLAMLKEKLAELGISETPREEFERKYKHYAQHWREILAQDEQN